MIRFSKLREREFFLSYATFFFLSKFNEFRNETKIAEVVLFSLTNLSENRMKQ